MRTRSYDRRNGSELPDSSFSLPSPFPLPPLFSLSRCFFSFPSFFPFGRNWTRPWKEERRAVEIRKVRGSRFFFLPLLFPPPRNPFFPLLLPLVSGWGVAGKDLSSFAEARKRLDASWRHLSLFLFFFFFFLTRLSPSGRNRS